MKRLGIGAHFKKLNINTYASHKALTPAWTPLGRVLSFLGLGLQGLCWHSAKSLSPKGASGVSV